VTAPRASHFCRKVLQDFERIGAAFRVAQIQPLLAAAPR
jgi:hypothetical protein